MFKQKKGQSTLEYAVLVVVIVAALLAIKIYMGRGVQGKLRESVDQIGEQYSAEDTTYKVSTEQGREAKTKETFGVKVGSWAGEAGAKDQGLSYYEVVSPADTTRKTEAGGEEKIDTTVADESLFN